MVVQRTKRIGTPADWCAIGYQWFSTMGFTDPESSVYRGPVKYGPKSSKNTVVTGNNIENSTRVYF